MNKYITKVFVEYLMTLNIIHGREYPLLHSVVGGRCKMFGYILLVRLSTGYSRMTDHTCAG